MQDDKNNKNKKKKSWGWPSYNVDDENQEDPQLIYTRVETTNRVNQYVDNGDGGHGHFSWDKKKDFDNAESPNFSRPESNYNSNPTSEEINKGSGCYLTSACVAHYREEFNDECYELQMLRWFRDTYVSKSDVKHYYKVAPTIVDKIEKEKHSQLIFEKIYAGIIIPCVKDIEQMQFDKAYDRYKKTIMAFEKKYCVKDQEEINNNELVNK